MSVIRLLFEQIALKKRAISWKKRIFLLFLTVIPPIFAQEQIASVTLRSVACFLRATGVICSQRSLKKSYCEQITPVTLYKRFAPVAHDKRATGAIHSFSQANHSFAHKKRAVHSKNQWANWQPWVQVVRLVERWSPVQEILSPKPGLFM